VPPSNLANQQHLWRISEPDRRAWLHRVVISPDTITITVKGTSLDGVAMELSTPTDMRIRRVGRTGRVRLRLPAGLADISFLVLRREDEPATRATGSSESNRRLTQHQGPIFQAVNPETRGNKGVDVCKKQKWGDWRARHSPRAERLGSVPVPSGTNLFKT
jgi:hypothetical protein